MVHYALAKHASIIDRPMSMWFHCDVRSWFWLNVVIVIVIALLQLLPATRSLERMRGICFTVCCFVWSTISQQPAGRFTPKFACGRTLVPDVSSPFLGVSSPRRTEKVGNEIFVTIGVNGEFLHFGSFWAISQERVHGSTPNIICVRTMSADVPPPHVGSIGPWGAGEGELKTQKIGGWSHSCIGQLPFLSNVVQYVGHRSAHILV